MMLALIIACEVGFWVTVVSGLAARYLLGLRSLGAALLVCAPLIDVVLLAAVAVHLTSGATASWHHGLAALYIGFSVTYGHRMITGADARFAHWFASGPTPATLTAWQYTKQCWGDVLRTLGAVAIAAGILTLIAWWISDSARTQSLTQWYGMLGMILAIEFIWALSYTIWPRKAPPRPACQPRQDKHRALTSSDPFQ